MANDRLSPLDTSFLHLEDRTTHMHVACVMVFDGPAPSYEDFVARVGSRLHLVPRYRQKLAFVPLNQGRPRWADDPHFDLRYHVRATSLPGRRTEYDLQVLAGRVFSQQLSRAKPLWELWLVEELERGRFAVLSKTHHALVDGISGLDILSVLFAPDEDGADGPERWTPEPAPEPTRLLGEAIAERVTVPAEMVRPARAMLRRPGQLAAGLRDAAKGLASLVFDGLAPAPPSPYNPGAIGPDRRFTWVRCSLADLKAIKNNLGGTVNDVVLTVVTRALRHHLDRRGELEPGQTLKAFVPVSVRTEDQQGSLGNQVSGMVATLPISCDDPAVCLRRISDELQGLKDSGQAVGAQALTELSGFAPPNIMSQAARVLARQRFFNLVVTNVPGPQFPLHLGERELRDIFPMVPLAKNQALGVAILSYNGGMNFGLVGDFDELHDIEDLADDFRAAVKELAAAAKVRLKGEGAPAPKRFVRKPAVQRPGAPELSVIAEPPRP
jgi:WS/DGAT/MGAT family acyltransferase